MRTLVIFFLLFFLQIKASAKLDDSADIFFPKSLKFLQYAQTEFPVFWWNFIVVDDAGGAPNYSGAQEICGKLQAQVNQEIKQIVCGDSLSSFIPSLIQWSEDLPLREKATQYPGIENTLKSSLSEIGFLSSVSPDLFRLKRADPLDQWQVYLEKNQALAANLFKRERGFLVDPKTGRIIIPVQFAQKPQMKNVWETKEILKTHLNTVMVGAHASAYMNEKQVHEDMDIVSVVGSIVLIVFIAFLVLRGRLSALLLFPPVALSLGLSAYIVTLIYGSIHGLTLAFGSGIVGLAVDYGLHGAFNAGSKQTWKSNAVGFLTTLTGLVVMIMSGIPLIRQMMVFAVLGLFFGFMFFYFLCKYAPKYFTMKSVDLPMWRFKFGHLIVIALIVVGFGSLFKTNLSFDLRKINFQPAKDKAMTEWFFSYGGAQENFLLLRSKVEFNPEVLKEASWAKENSIQHAGLGDFWPPGESEQSENIQSWLQVCPKLEKNISSNEAKVFSPFLNSICDQERKFLSFEDLSQREYSKHLVGSERFISIFTSHNPEQAALIREKFPQAKSLTESVKGFSDSLESDLRWMIPVVFVISTLILFLYYKSLTCVITAYIPFFTGLGLFFLVNLLKGGGLDLISVLGLVMVFGFSLDYGVFSTDIYKFPQDGEDEKKVYSALGLAAISNIIGFFPMVFAQHPVLHQLGMALFFGTIGTYLGTIWGVEKIYHWRKLL